MAVGTEEKVLTLLASSYSKGGRNYIQYLLKLPKDIVELLGWRKGDRLLLQVGRHKVTGELALRLTKKTQ